ncbi:MAG: hypothetical protein K2I92_03485, partial [Muribaculaceae bacterium]|nr:hypothetical protein [Muribaculaceae bacterium]
VGEGFELIADVEVDCLDLNVHSLKVLMVVQQFRRDSPSSITAIPLYHNNTCRQQKLQAYPQCAKHNSQLKNLRGLSS